MSKKRKWLLAAMTILAVWIAAAAWYVNDYYRAEPEALACTQSTTAVTVTEIDGGLLFDGAGEDTALVFYPGAKVEYTAYAPLMQRLAEGGVDCFLLKMPCNLAIFGINRAQSVTAGYDYESWYMAGHSLGGAMAATYCAEHLEDVDGLVLLAAYSTKSLQAEGFSVLSIYGSEDGVLSREKLAESRALMPDDYTEVELQGGNHAGFGLYGAQDGDGAASITPQEQQDRTADLILDFATQKRA